MLFCETYGRCSDQHPFPLIFLHGFLGSHRDWMPVITLLQNEYECTAIDLPAHGNSPYSEDVTLEVETTLQKWPNPILVGYSLGGRIALGYGQKHPELIRGIIALSAHTGLDSEELRYHRLQNDIIWENRLRSLSSEQFLSLWYEQKVFSSLRKRPEFLQHLQTQRTYQNPDELASLLNQVSLAKQPLYQNFSHPLALLYGVEDVSYAELYTKWPTANKREIPESGHIVHLENPAKCAEAIAFFAARYSSLTV